MKFMGIEITRTYDNNSWRDDLKSFMFEAGCENRPTIFFFSDTQIIKESMLEDVRTPARCLPTTYPLPARPLPARCMRLHAS
jgi:dynein heavy chain